MMNGREYPLGLEGAQVQMRRLAGRDYELLGIGLLVMTALCFGLLAFVICAGFEKNLPQVSSLPQLVGGLVALLVLLNAYVVNQKRILHRATDLLLQQVASERIVQQYSFIDSSTQLFAREYLDHAIAHQIMQVNRHGRPLTFLLLQARGGGAGASSEQYITSAAQLLRSNFRGSDTLIRFGLDTFLVIMAETSEQGGHIAVRRLLEKVDQWNISVNIDMELTFLYRLRAFAAGKQPQTCIEELEREFAAFSSMPDMPYISKIESLPVQIVQ